MRRLFGLGRAIDTRGEKMTMYPKEKKLYLDGGLRRVPNVECCTNFRYLL